MMTNDMDDDQYLVFDEREKARVDKLHHSRKMMNTLVERRMEQYRKAKEERDASKKKKINVDNLGEYKSKKFMVDQMD